MATVLPLAAVEVRASDCAEVSIAEMDWQSAKLLANIDAIILEHGYDCEVTLVPGDTMATFTTMDQEGTPDVAPELWINAYRNQVDEAVKDGRLQIAAPALIDGGVEGWWIPNYIAEAYPEIRTVRDALERPDLFPDLQDSDKGAVHTCPSGWNCRISTGNLFRAYDAEDKGFKLVQAQTG
ncbi:MAG: glycine betaine ABC transporter substrate-binding protein, partial [Pseudomonadota bacterium]